MEKRKDNELLEKTLPLMPSIFSSALVFSLLGLSISSVFSESKIVFYSELNSPNSYHGEEEIYHLWKKNIVALKSANRLKPNHSLLVFSDTAMDDFIVRLIDSHSNAQEGIWKKISESLVLCPRLPCSSKERILRAKARTIASSIQQTMAQLAIEFRIGILAGCLDLPKPSVTENTLNVLNEEIQNICLFFDKDGKIHEIPQYPSYNRSLLTTFGKIRKVSKFSYELIEFPGGETQRFPQ